MTSIGQNAELILREQQAVITRVEENDLRSLSEAIQEAPRVFVLGEGRSGLVMRMLAVRLMHLGKPAFVVGETITPAIEPGDLLIACSGSGETDVTCLLAEKAVAAEATLAVLTADRQSRLARAANVVISIPTQHKTGAGAITTTTVQFGASLFEQCALVLCEAIVLGRMPESKNAVVARHANLE